MKKTYTVLSAILLGAAILLAPGLLSPEVCHGQTVKISFPSFQVTLNGKLVDNAARQYPLIVYRDITYIPLTWHDSRFLGLETKWDNKAGLYIHKADVAGGYYEDISTGGSSRSASVPGFAVTVNGKAVNNSAEEYPLLLFRDVTYIPLTWRFAVGEFGWRYDFTQTGGLTVSSDNVNSMETMTIRLPIVSHYGYPAKCAIAEDFIYYEGKDGKVYSAPLSDPAKAKQVFQLPLNPGYGGDPFANSEITAQSGRAYLQFHTGGGIMGSDHIFRLNPDGEPTDWLPSPEEMDGLYNASSILLYTLSDLTVLTQHYGPPIPKNLVIRNSGESKYRRIGDPSLFHSSVTRVGNDLYTLATPAGDDGAYTPTNYSVYRTNILTGKSERLINDGIENMDNVKFIGDHICYRDKNNRPWIADLDGQNAVLLMDRQVERAFPFGNDVYYTLSDSGVMRRLSDGKELNPGEDYTEAVISGDFLWLTSSPKTGNGNERMILDKKGTVIYQSGIEDQVILYNGKMIYIKQK